MIVCRLIVVAVFIGVVCLAAEKKRKSSNFDLPSYVGKGCSHDDPKINECIVRKGAPAIVTIAKGDPKYHIPRLDPLVIEKLKINQGTRQVGLSLECNNCSLYGLQNTKLYNAKIDLKKLWCQWDFELDRLEVLGKYVVKGQVLLLPISGNGNANITLTGLKFSYIFNWKLEKRENGLEYAVVTNNSLPFEVEQMYINLENLFNGDKLLGSNMNIFLNENWREIMKDLSPALSESLAEIFRRTLTSMAETVPYSKIFPKD